MRLHSTAESVENREISLLAIVETIIASSIAIYLSVKFNSFKWIAWSACIAPFLLLRTEESTNYGIDLFDKRVDWIRSKMFKSLYRIDFSWRMWFNVLYGLSIAFYFAIMPILVRFLSFIVAIWRHPLKSFSSIPENWIRATMSIDVCVPPEVVPGYEVQGPDDKMKFRHLRDLSLWEKGDYSVLKLLEAAVVIPTLILLFVPPLLYRWSMKATSIVYAPLLWIVRSSRGIADIPDSLKLIRKSDLMRIAVCYSTLVIIGFVLKLLLMMKWGNFVAWWNTTPLTEFLAIYVMPAEIPIWQLAAFINAFCAIGIFIYAKEASLRMDTGDPWSTKTVEAILRYSGLVRCALSLYMIVCTGYLTVQAATTWNLPKLGTKLFPWIN